VPASTIFDVSSHLTTAESWDAIWAAQAGQRSPVRSRLKMYRAWDQLLGQLLDAGGSDAPRDVLELGCAPGAMIEQLHRLRPQHTYRGIDFARRGLELARQRLAAADIDARLYLGDIATVDVEPADLVVSFGLIEHFDDPVEAMAYHRRFVKPGGMTAVTVPNYAHPALVPLLRRFSPETLATHNLEIMNPQAMTAALRAAGFRDVDAGYAGLASVPSSRVRRDRWGRAFGFAARAWNVAVPAVVPAGWPWSAYVWATGHASG
jgi:SAM-dependent methyltransferase